MYGSQVSVGTSFLRAFLRLHDGVYRATDGRIGHHLIAVPSLLLRTTGRQSGLPRTTTLIYARDGADFVLVASNHGLGRRPGWLHNVAAEPRVGLQVGRRKGTGRARIVERGDPDYERLWRLVNEANHHRYEGYQRRTSRPIPLVTVTPDAPLA